MTMLSIITPFYNSKHKCDRLLCALDKIDDPDVEAILVDDGSSDNTASYLNRFSKRTKLKTIVISQNNMGAAVARNNGYLAAKGEYVWFVDSDDEISPEAINLLKTHRNYDCIDFNFMSGEDEINSMGIETGSYDDPMIVKRMLLNNYGRIWTKIIRRKIILENKIYYPPYCEFEDNSLIFIFPFFIKSLYKTDMVGYYYHQDFESGTRRTYNSLRWFDRMIAANYGLSRAELLADESEREKLNSHFIRQYLINTVGGLIGRGNARFKQLPDPRWIVASRVMKSYRSMSKKHSINARIFSFVAENTGWKYWIAFSLLWCISYLFPSQDQYFEKLRCRAWDRPFLCPKELA